MNEPNDNGSKKPVFLKADCSECRGVRNCDVRGHFEQKGGDEDFLWRLDWYILQCRGCDNVFVKTIGTNSEDYENYYEYDGSTGTTYNETESYWPALTKRSFPDWMSEVGIEANDVQRLDEILLELYKSLNNDLYILAGIGIRTSFDVAASLLGADNDLNFTRKIEYLHANGNINEKDTIRLSSLVEAGNASAHRGWKPTVDDLSTMMSVLEDFIYESFIMPARKSRTDSRIAQLQKAVPPRSK